MLLMLIAAALNHTVVAAALNHTVVAAALDHTVVAHTRNALEAGAPRSRNGCSRCAPPGEPTRSYGSSPWGEASRIGRGVTSRNGPENTHPRIPPTCRCRRLPKQRDR